MSTSNSDQTQDVWPIEARGVVNAVAQAFAEATGYYTEFHPGLSSVSADKLRAGAWRAIKLIRKHTAVNEARQQIAALHPLMHPKELADRLAALASFLEAEGMPSAAEIVTEAKAALERPRRDFNTPNPARVSKPITQWIGAFPNYTGTHYIIALFDGDAIQKRLVSFPKGDSIRAFHRATAEAARRGIAFRDVRETLTLLKRARRNLKVTP